MSKNGYCPTCKASVRREGKRLSSSKRINIIPAHHHRNQPCDGGGLLWQHALHPAPSYKITIVELPDRDL